LTDGSRTDCDSEFLCMYFACLDQSKPRSILKRDQEPSTRKKQNTIHYPRAIQKKIPRRLVAVTGDPSLLCLDTTHFTGQVVALFRCFSKKK
jgi:hypothetical protein